MNAHPASLSAFCDQESALSQKVYCGHEYSLQNLKFASSVDGANEHLRQKMAFAKVRQLSERHGFARGIYALISLETTGRAITCSTIHDRRREVLQSFHAC